MVVVMQADGRCPFRYPAHFGLTHTEGCNLFSSAQWPACKWGSPRADCPLRSGPVTVRFAKEDE